jgi:DnaB-like helicase C terminal domain
VPFWVVDGNFKATVEDIWVAARQLKQDAIFIDGAYLLKHPTERDRYRRVAENADLIQQELSNIAPTVCPWQFSREAAKKIKNKGPDQVSLEDIGYSDVIGQVSSLVLGLFEGDSPETVKQRRIEILKGRNGEVGGFITRWDWVGMHFEEVLDEPIETLSFL